MIRHFISEKNEPIIEFLSRELGLTSVKSLEMLNFGAVYLNKNRQLEATEIKTGDYIRAHTEPKRFSVKSIDWSSLLLFENQDFLVINKPGGIPTHATVANRYENVVDQMKKHLGYDVYVTSRLDVVTNGLLVLAKTKKFQTEFNNALRDSRVTKYYEAIVENHIQHPLHLTHYMKNDYTQPKILSDEAQDGFLKCELKIFDSKKLSLDNMNQTQIRIELLTGRTHQIRSQLSQIGHPILGDKLYGSKLPWLSEDTVSLTAYYLRFQLSEKFEFNLHEILKLRTQLESHHS